jgi:hypothetical protein
MSYIRVGAKFKEKNDFAKYLYKSMSYVKSMV